MHFGGIERNRPERICRAQKPFTLIMQSQMRKCILCNFMLYKTALLYIKHTCTSLSHQTQCRGALERVRFCIFVVVLLDFPIQYRATTNACTHASVREFYYSTRALAGTHLRNIISARACAYMYFPGRLRRCPVPRTHANALLYYAFSAS